MVCQIACDKFGYRVILALLDVVDDTVLLSKVQFLNFIKYVCM